MAFPNPIVAGQELQIEGIQSTNYVAGVTGWRLGQDGSVQIPRGTVLDELESNNYVEGVSGWKLDEDGNVQLPNVNVLDTVGAGTVSTDTLTVGGEDIITDVIDPLPTGLTAFGTLGATQYAAGGATDGSEQAWFMYNAGAISASRYYRCRCSGHLQSTNPGDQVDLQVHYRTDGKAAGYVDPILPGTLARYVCQPGGAHFDLLYNYVPGANYPSLQMTLTAKRVSGSGAIYCYLASTARRFEWEVIDMGPWNGTSPVSQYSYYTPSPPPPTPPPPANYKKTWNATWYRSFNQDGSIWQNYGVETSSLYQGYYSGIHGNTRSLAGFDYADIQNTLSGATVTGSLVTYKIQHTYDSTGADIQIGTHSYTSKPGSWSSGNVNSGRWSKTSPAGSTIQTGTTTALGNDFKSGAAKGIAFGPAPNNSSSYYAYLYPQVSITIYYTK